MRAYVILLTRQIHVSAQNTAFMIVFFAAHSPSDAVDDLPVILLGP